VVPIITLQLLLPLTLLTLLAPTTPRNWLGLVSLILAISSLLVAYSVFGLWTFLPWWTVPLLRSMLILCVAAVLVKRRSTISSVLPRHAGAWCAAALFLVLAVLAFIPAPAALSGRTVPPGTTVELAFPLREGSFMVINGGSHRLVNAHLAILDATDPLARSFRGQAHAVDIVKLGSFGLRARGLRPEDPAAYEIYAATVLAPCSGEVVAAVDGLPDLRVPEVDRANVAGNHVLLRCGSFDVLLAHLRPGSLKVIAGSLVETGDVLGEVGNSGNTDEPHLHIHAQTRGSAEAPFSGEPLPMLFRGRYLVRNERIRTDSTR